MKQPTLFDEPSNGTETQSAEAQLQRQVETARDPLTAQIVNPIIANILLDYENLNEEANRIIDDTLNFLIDIVPEIAKVEVKNYVQDQGFSQFHIGISQFSIKKIGDIIEEMKGKWIIAIDESMVDEEMLSGNISYRHSAAFGMRIDETGREPKEKMLALSSAVKIQEEEHFKDKMMFISYLMNLFTAYYTAKFLTSIGERVHSIIIHGPLIRQLGPFMKLGFKRNLLHKVFSLGKNVELGDHISPDIKNLAEGGLLKEILDSHDYEWCLEQLKGGQIIQFDDYDSTVSGVALYLCLLKRLYDLSRSKNFYMIGCVETVRSSEYSDIYFRYQAEQYFNKNADKRHAFEKLLQRFGIQPQADSKACFLQLREKAGWDDEKLSFFSVKYDAAQQRICYTNPVPIRRYFSVLDNQNVIGDAQLAQRISSTSDRAQNLALKNMLKQTLKFPDYKVLMSYVRTSELKAPIRVEFFETGNWHNVVPFVYAVSQPYSSFGLPVFLYFADKIARVPKSVISTVTTELLMKKAVEYVTKNPQGDMHFVQIVNALLNKFRRDFTQR
jgi:hypothetical protein